jgi:hypothetical protein
MSSHTRSATTEAGAEALVLILRMHPAIVHSGVGSAPGHSRKPVQQQCQLWEIRPTQYLTVISLKSLQPSIEGLLDDRENH